MTENQVYERLYSSTVEPQYGEARNDAKDRDLLLSNALPHAYAITERVDCTHHPTYTIDPEGCEDADDAFSIYEEDDTLYLDIHIADPTELINPASALWDDVVSRVVTRYPSNRPPIHMMPREIMNQASLMDGANNLKNAVTVRSKIDPATGAPVGVVQLLFTTVQVRARNQYTYREAAALATRDFVLTTGLNISRALTRRRAENTVGVVLNDVSNSYVRFTGADAAPQLYQSTHDEASMKQMIAEFAIYANAFVGQYLNAHLHGVGIFRTCDVSDWLQTVDGNIRGADLLNRIVTEGIQADYLSRCASHDLVGMSEYCHFTSPLRRLADCVCHYLLKTRAFEKYPSVFPRTLGGVRDPVRNCYEENKEGAPRGHEVSPHPDDEPPIASHWTSDLSHLLHRRLHGTVPKRHCVRCRPSCGARVLHLPR